MPEGRVGLRARASRLALAIVATLVGSMALGWLGEAWHASMGPCHSLLPPTGHVGLDFCSHPEGFFVWDAVLIAASALLLSGGFHALRPIAHRLLARNPSPSPAPGISQSLIPALLAAGLAALATPWTLPLGRLFPLSPIVPRPLLPLREWGQILWGALLFTGSMLLLGLAVLLGLTRLRKASGTGHSAVWGATGAAWGGIVAVLSSSLHPLSPTSLWPDPFLGIWLYAPAFAYAFVSLADAGSRRFLLTRRGAVVLGAVHSLVFVPPLLAFPALSLPLILPYLAVLGLLALRGLGMLTPHPEEDQ